MSLFWVLLKLSMFSNCLVAWIHNLFAGPIQLQKSSFCRCLVSGLWFKLLFWIIRVGVFRCLVLRFLRFFCHILQRFMDCRILSFVHPSFLCSFRVFVHTANKHLKHLIFSASLQLGWDFARHVKIVDQVLLNRHQSLWIYVLIDWSRSFKLSLIIIKAFLLALANEIFVLGSRDRSASHLLAVAWERLLQVDRRHAVCKVVHHVPRRLFQVPVKNLRALFETRVLVTVSLLELIFILEHFLLVPLPLLLEQDPVWLCCVKALDPGLPHLLL
jgi:hypothetical protein